MKELRRECLCHVFCEKLRILDHVALARRLHLQTDASHSSDSSQNATNTSLKTGTGHRECIPGANLSTSLDLSTGRAAPGSMGESAQHSGPGHSTGRALPRAPKNRGTHRPGHAHPSDCANLLHRALGVLQCRTAVGLTAPIAGYKMPSLPAAPVNVCPGTEWKLKFQYFSQNPKINQYFSRGWSRGRLFSVSKHCAPASTFLKWPFLI